MATQYGEECWCSKDVDLDFTRHTGDEEGDFGLCDMFCTGNSVSLPFLLYDRGHKTIIVQYVMVPL